MPQWPPRVPRAGGSGPTPPGGADIRAPKLIVGNEPAGDTIDVCDFLDPGDGTGIAAALAAAADTGGDIWLRPGRYNMGLPDSPPLPLSMNGGITIRGSGSLPSTGTFGPGASASVIVVGDQRAVLTASDFVDLIDIYFEVAPIAVAAAGTRMVNVATGFLRMTRVSAFLPFGFNTNESLQWLFSAGTLRAHNSQILGAYQNGAEGGTPLGVYLANTLESVADWMFGVDIGAQLGAGSVTGGDWTTALLGMEIRGRAHISSLNLIVEGPATAGIQVTGADASVIGCYIRGAAGEGQSAQGIAVGAGSTRCRITGNHISDFETAVFVGSGARVLIGFNDLEDNGESVADQSLYTENAHNYVAEPE